MLLNEVYSSLNSDGRTLPAMGIRSTFEIAASMLGADPAATYNEKIDYLLSKHHIKLDDVADVKLLIEVGNASIHRGWVPSENDLCLLMEILEGLIYRCIVIPTKSANNLEAVSELRNSIPPRPARQKGR
ncbi:DUF4145 domain-containing protein [Methylobacterium brachiatum]